MLKGIGISGFRSFGKTTQYLYPLSKINIISGRNNSGKSNVLRFINLLGKIHHHSDQAQPIVEDDLHDNTEDAECAFHFPIDLSEDSFDELFIHWYQDPSAQSQKLLFRYLAEYFKTQTTGEIPPETAWTTYRHDGGGWNAKIPDAISVRDFVITKNLDFNIEEAWDWLYKTLGKPLFNDDDFWRERAKYVISHLIGISRPNFPCVSTINSKRHIGPPGSNHDNFDGNGLIKKLLELQCPELSSRDQSKLRFSNINIFIRQVLEEPNAQIEVPATADELNIEINGVARHIQNYGDGVHQVLIIAVAATLIEDSIVCIEEPETNLHPRLQRQLMRYLQDNTSNQYFITTHSAAILDTPDASIFHVENNSQKESSIRHMDTPKGRAEAVFELGYKASDLLQANCIIWVEGPSDKVYVKAWIKSIAPKFIEGTHYSIMFYGGKLLSHLSADDESFKDFICLLKINRNVFLIMDSDKQNEGDPLRETKVRISRELEEHNGHYWVTSGREIENYIRPSQMREILKQVHPTKTFDFDDSQWTCCYMQSDGKAGSIDKLEVAKRAVKNVDLDFLDLRPEVTKVVDFIKTANQI